MLQDVLDRITERLAVVGLSATAASKLAGLGEDAIRNMKRAVATDERRGVSTNTIAALAPVLQTSVGWLLTGEGEAETTVPTVRVPVGGKVGAGAQVETLEPSEPRFIEAPIAWNDATAYIVTGDSCYPVYEEGDYIIVRGAQRLAPEECEGRMCIVETTADQGLVKRVFDDGRGTFTLESPNAPPLRRVELRFARPVKLRLDPSEVRR